MASLPLASEFTGSTVTEAQFKTAITDQRTFLADLLGTDGTKATALATLNSLLATYVSKSTNYSVVVGDRGKLINCTASLTITTPAAATVGAGFAFGVRNSGVGTVTIDGNAAELVDGAATIAIAAGESALIVSTGTAWVTIGKTASIADGSITTVKLASAMGSAAYNYNTEQLANTTYTTYISQAITLDTSDALSVLASIGMEIITPANAGTNTVNIRLLVDGVTRATNMHTVSFQSGYDTPVHLPIAARVTGLSSGARTAAVQIYAASGVSARAVAGSMLIIKEPT